MKKMNRVYKGEIRKYFCMIYIQKGRFLIILKDGIFALGNTFMN